MTWDGEKRSVEAGGGVRGGGGGGKGKWGQQLAAPGWFRVMERCLLDHAVEGRSLVTVTLFSSCQGPEVLSCLGHRRAVQAQRDPPERAPAVLNVEEHLHNPSKSVSWPYTAITLSGSAHLVGNLGSLAGGRGERGEGQHGGGHERDERGETHCARASGLAWFACVC